MMSRTKNTKNHSKDLLPLATIEAASQGDPSALRAVVKHYEGYILTLSVVRLYDKEGNTYAFIDDSLRRELELRLITKVVGFKFKSAA